MLLREPCAVWCRCTRCRPEGDSSVARCGRRRCGRARAGRRRGGRGRCAGQWRAARAADARTAVSSRSPPCPARAYPAPPDSMAHPTATITRSHALTTVRISERILRNVTPKARSVTATSIHAPRYSRSVTVLPEPGRPVRVGQRKGLVSIRSSADRKE